MIGHFLLSLSEEQEDRLLTRPIGLPWSQIAGSGNPGCVFQVACARKEGRGYPWQLEQMWHGVGLRFDAAYMHFGPRLITAIRNRILSNRARRTLQNRPVQHMESVSR